MTIADMDDRLARIEVTLTQRITEGKQSDQELVDSTSRVLGISKQTVWFAFLGLDTRVNASGVVELISSDDVRT